MSYEKFSYYYDSLMDQRFYDDYYHFILKHVSFKNVFELGCGTGEMALRLADHCKVYASDLSEDMLEVARMKAMYENKDISFSRVDMTNFEIAESLDLVLCLCDSLNYVLDQSDVKKVFENVYHCLNKSGAFIFDVNSLYKMNVILNDYKEENEDEDFYFMWNVKKIEDGYVLHEVKIIDKNEDDEVYEKHYQKTYAIDVYKKMLEDCGFHSIEIYSDFEEYKENGERCIFICRKGEQK